MNLAYRVFRWARAWKARQNGGEYMLKNEVDAVKASCILEIQQAVKPLRLSVKELSYRVGVKAIQNLRALVIKGDTGKQTMLGPPPFTQMEIVFMRIKYFLNVFAITGIVVAETSLYTITAAIFLPGSSPLTKTLLAVFLAGVTALSLDFSFGNIFRYLANKARHSRKEISDTELKQSKDLFIISIILFSMTITAVLLAGISRAYFLEGGIDPRGLSVQKFQNITKSSGYGSVFAVLATLLATILMAFLKADQMKVAQKYRTYTYWENAHVRRNKYNQKLIRNTNLIQEAIEYAIMKHWMIIIDIRRACKLEYESRFDRLHQDYLKLKARTGFSVTPEIYNAYRQIESAHEELFKAGIYQDKTVQAKLALANDAQMSTEAHLNEQLGKAVAESTSPDRIPATNGKAKEYEFIIN